MKVTQNCETLIVTRDGQLDDEYYDAVYAERRQEVLQAAGRELVHLAVRAPLVLGKGMVYLLTHEALQAK